MEWQGVYKFQIILINVINIDDGLRSRVRFCLDLINMAMFGLEQTMLCNI